MTATAGLVRRFTVAGFTAEVTLPKLERGAVVSAVIEWTPHVPDFHNFTAAERSAYRLALMKAIAEVSA